MSDSGTRILVVDDDPSIRDLLRRRLEVDGYTVIQAEDGWGAVEQVGRELPDLMILDMMMPRLDGIGVIRRLRARPETAMLPILMLTARDRPADRTLGLETGADDYLGKPFEWPELLARVKALLRRSRGEHAQTAEDALRGEIVAIVGAKGGVGTTTVAVNLGVALARAGTATVLADLTTFHGAAAELLGIVPRRRLDRLPLAHPEVMTVPMIEDTLLPHPSGLRLLAGLAGDQEVPGDQGIGALLEGLRRLAKVVVVDLDSPPGPLGRGAMGLARQIWVVTEPEPIAASRAGAIIAALERAGIRPKQIALIANQTSPGMISGGAEIAERAGRPVFYALPAAPRACFEAARRGVPLVDLAPELPAAQALVALATAIAARPAALPAAPVASAEPVAAVRAAAVPASS